MSILAWFILGVVIAVGLFAYYMIVNQKVLAKFDVSMFTIEPATYVYTTFQGQYQAIGPVYELISGDVSAYLDSSSVKDSKQVKPDRCGVYYDNPFALKDPNTGRALAGLLVREDFDIAGFLRHCKERKSKVNYHVVKLGRLQAFGAHFPLHGTAGMMANIVRGYPAIREWSLKEKNGLMERSICALETYDWDGQQMGICFVYGKNAEALHGLSKYAQPEYKQGIAPIKTVKRRL